MPHPLDKTVARRIRNRRLTLGKSQAEVARLVGVSYQHVSRIEQGETALTVSRLVDFAEALQTTPWSFLEGIEP